MFLNSKLFYMNNKTMIMNSTFISSEELCRSRSVLSALANPSHDTQPHAIIVKNKINSRTWVQRKPVLQLANWASCS